MHPSPLVVGRPSVRLASGLAAFGDRPALVEGDRAVTYGELAERVEAVGAVLGTQRRLVAVHAGATTAGVTGYLAALGGGHATLVLPADAEHAAAVLDRYDPDVVLSADGALVERRPDARHELHEDLALLLSTSGSTGAPKLVRLSAAAVQSNAEAIAAYLELRADDVAITSLPLHYCYGLSILHSHLAVGAAVVLTDLSVVDSCFWDAVQRWGVTGIAGVPHTFDLLDRAGFEHREVPSLRRVTQAGGRLPADGVRRYAELGRRRGWDLVVMYGQTEATARMAYLPPDLALEHPTCIGRAIPGGELTLDAVDEATGIGELVYRGPNVMLGYAEQAADLARGRDVHELRTGDLARAVDGGLFEVVGRQSRFVKLFGLRIDLDHAEALLAAAGVPALCTGTDERLVAAVPPGRRDDAADVLRRSIGLPRGAVQVVEADPLPRLPSGKPDHRAVRDLAAAQPYASATDVAAGSVEAALRAVLGVAAVEPTDTFVSLGGDSLSYVEMSIRLEEVLGDLPDGWQALTVEELGARVGPRRSVTRLDTTLVLRGIAIALVVATHAGVAHIPGGAHLLFAIAGCNFARFAGNGRVARSIARIALPAMAWMAGVALVVGDLGLPHVLLLNGAFGDRHGRWAYWYIEALVHVLVVVAALLAVPAVARLRARRPAAVPWALVAGGLVLRFDLVPILDLHHRTKRPHELLWLFGLGWLAALCRSNGERALVSVVAAVGLHDFFGQPPREALILAGFLLVVWVPTLPVVRPVNRWLGGLAGASLAIYLTHWEVYPHLADVAGRHIAFAGSIAVGVAVQRALPRALRAGAAYCSSATPRSLALVTARTPRTRPRIASTHATAPTYQASASPP